MNFCKVKHKRARDDTAGRCIFRGEYPPQVYKNCSDRNYVKTHTA